MCDPVTLAAVSIGFSAAQGIGNYVMQSAAANAQEKQNAQNRYLINQAANENIAAQNLQRKQERAAASYQLFDSRVETVQTAERARVAAGEAGVSGLSVDALLADFYRQDARFEDAIGTNFENYSLQVDANNAETVRDGESRIANLPAIQRPSLALTGLQIGMGAFDAYDKYLRAPEAAPKVTTRNSTRPKTNTKFGR